MTARRLPPLLQELLVAAILVLVVAPPTDAQEQAPQPGARVRVSLLPEPEPPAWIIGTWQSADGDHVVLRGGDGDVRTIPRDSIARLQVSVGRTPGPAQGALVGLALGTFAGVILQSAACSAGGEQSACIANGFLFFGAAGAAAGSLVGAIIGAVTRSERWQDVSR